MNLKEVLLVRCTEFVEKRLRTLQASISDIQQSLTTETKSSAGDKHETGRAMLQLEREKAGNQLAEVQKLNEALSKIDISSNSDTVSLGSIVFTSDSNYFIAISAGEMLIDHQNFYAISPTTPIGKLLIGRRIGDTVAFRDKEFKIDSII